MRVPTILLVGCFVMIQVAGCTESTSSGDAGKATTSAEAKTTDSKQDDREQAFAQLSAEDRVLAEAQGYCAVSEEPLGSMGTPLKMLVKDQLVWICCEGCKGKVKSSGDEMLAKAETLRERVIAEHKK